MGAKELMDLPVSERAFQLLRDKILRCEYEPGVKLKIDTLQRDLGVSSSPLREALSRLVVEGLVVSDERRGFSAAPVSVKDLRDVTRLRLMLDCEALAESIEHGDDQWEANIVTAFHWLSRIEGRHGEGPLTLDADWTARHKDFHMALLAGLHLRQADEVEFGPVRPVRALPPPVDQAPGGAAPQGGRAWPDDGSGVVA